MYEYRLIDIDHLIFQYLSSIIYEFILDGLRPVRLIDIYYYYSEAFF